MTNSTITLSTNSTITLPYDRMLVYMEYGGLRLFEYDGIFYKINGHVKIKAATLFLDLFRNFFFEIKLFIFDNNMLELLEQKCIFISKM